MSVKQLSVSYSVRTAVAVILGNAALLASAPFALAQQGDGPAKPAEAAPAQATVEEVTVTGTRIKRKDLESSSPLVTIDSTQLENHAGFNLESYLNQLPNYNPAQTPVTENQDVQPSAVNTVGISSISLRGFGPNRSLVLVDGHRTTPVNALMVTDINTIPSAMIDRVEIITGGASTVYGADAIGGVTNFITKKNFQGLETDVQYGIAEVGDNQELRATAIMGTKIGDGKGNITMGVEYYNRDGAYEKNRDFYTNAWKDPTVGGSDLFIYGYNGYNSVFYNPSVAAASTVFPATNGVPFLLSGGGVFSGYRFDNQGGLWDPNVALAKSGYLGSTNSNGYGLVNEYDPTVTNSAAAGAPPVTQGLKWNNPETLLSSPQTRYSFFANGTYDITDKIQFYTNARFAQSKTATLLSVPPNASYGWEATIPYNQATDDPIQAGLIGPLTDAATLQSIATAFKTYGLTSANPYYNTGFIPIGKTGVQHPVPWQLAMLLDSRSVYGISPAAFGLTTLDPNMAAAFGIISASQAANSAYGAAGNVCQPSLAANLCTPASASWILETYPFGGLNVPGRSTVDTSTEFQIEAGLRFPLFADWTGDFYYSRGQSTNYENGYGNDSLERYRAVVDSPGYGAGQVFQGNANGASTYFGTSVPTTCTSGLYGYIFEDSSPSADCANAIGATLQTQTAIQQDIVEANFQGTLFKLPAGEVSAALGYQFRRDSAQFIPDGLQATNSFLDQTIGLYPLGTVDSQVTAKDGYAEFYVPLLQNLPFLQKLALDAGVRYSQYSNTPNATTFKVNLDAAITKSFRIRGGFNRATRSPNLGELYLGTQEYFGGGAAFGDPCALRSGSPFGAGGAAPDLVPNDATLPEAEVFNSNGLAGATSTYLICQAQMGIANPTAAAQGTKTTGYTAPATPFYTQTSQATGASVFAWLNEEGNPNLKSETANTITAGFVFSNLADSGWLAGLSGSIDWWEVDIKNAIGLDSPDYANYLCYGTVQVTNADEARAQAATPECQNVARSVSSGAGTTALLTYTNQGSLGTAGVDLSLNWIAQLEDLGLKGVPGAITFNTQDSFTNYYRTKQSPAPFDVTVDWKGSFGPTLAGTNPGTYSYRLTASIGYILPTVSVNLRWRFLPSIISAARAQQNAIIENNKKVDAGGDGVILGYTPSTALATPAWNAFDLSASWNVSPHVQIRGGINNLFDKAPAITAATAGYPEGTELNSVCDGRDSGCQPPTSYSLPSSGNGVTSAGFYDVYGRTYFLGVKATF